MAKFSYKFTPIKKIKELIEKKVLEEVSAIQIQIEQKEEEYKEIFCRQTNTVELKQKMKASDIQFYKNYRESLQEELNNKRKEIEELLSKKEDKMTELIQKSKEHKIFCKLEDISYEKYIREENKKEMNQINEIAIRNYVRKVN